jgi:hypothetical protein
VTVLAVSAAVLTMASPARAAWQPEEQVNLDDPAVTDVGAAYVGTADDGSAVAVWLEWRGDDVRLVASRRPVSGAWGPSQVVDDLTEKPGVTGGRADLSTMVVLPDGSALISYQEYDDDADADFVGKVVTLHPDGSVAEELNGRERQWGLVADAEGDWLATAREYDHCACENYTWYSGDGSAPEFLGTYPGFGLRFALSRDELVYYAVDDPDGLYQPAHTLRVQRINGATGHVKTVVLLKPHGEVRGFDIDANVSDDVDLVWSVRRPEKRHPDLVRAMRHRSGEAWSKPHTVWNYGTANNRPVGAPQVETSGDGKALTAWSSPPDDAGRVDLDSAVVRRGGPSSSVDRLASDVDPETRSLAFGIRVNDSGNGAVAFRHLAPCLSDADTMCHTVSAVLGRRIGRLHDPEVLFATPTTSYESLSMALSDSGVAVVLTVERGATIIETRTSP